MDQRQTIGTPMGGKSVTVAYTDTAGTTAALPETTRVVRVISTTDCFIAIGTAPTAVVNTGLLLAAYQPEYFAAMPNAKVSAIRLTASGSLYVTPF
jgi:precorrin isomerase